MALRVDKWVAAGIEAIKWSKLADMADASEVAAWCDFFDFHVAAVWIGNNSQAYQIALRDGLESTTLLAQDDVEHTRLHIAVTLSARANEILPRVDAKTADRIRTIITDQFPNERKSTRGTSAIWSSHTAG